MSLFGGISKAFKKIFSRRGLQTFLASAGGLLPGVQEFMLTDKGNEIYETIHKGLGNLVTGGYISQREALAWQKKQAKMNENQLAKEAARIKAEQDRLSNIEAERNKRLALYGNTRPSTLLGSYLGVTGGANLGRPGLG